MSDHHTADVPTTKEGEENIIDNDNNNNNENIDIEVDVDDNNNNNDDGDDGDVIKEASDSKEQDMKIVDSNGDNVQSVQSGETEEAATKTEAATETAVEPKTIAEEEEEKEQEQEQEQEQKEEQEAVVSTEEEEEEEQDKQESEEEKSEINQSIQESENDDNDDEKKKKKIEEKDAQERDQSIMESTEVQTASKNDSEMEVTRDVAEDQEQQEEVQVEQQIDHQISSGDSNGNKIDEQQQQQPLPTSIKRESTELTTIRTVTSNDRHSPDLNRQSVDVGGGVRRRSCDPSALIIRRFEDIPTAYHSFRRAAERFGNNPCLGRREKLPNGNAGPYRWLTYAEVKAKASNIAAGFKHIGVPNYGHVGIFSINCVEWQITSIAANMQSLCTISLYDTLGPESSLYITNHGEIHTLCFAPNMLDNVVELASKAEHLKNVVIFDRDEFPAEARQKCEEHNIGCYTFDELARIGAENPTSDVPPTPDTLYTIMYTSGTTGLPKGVMLTHRNVIAAVTGVAHQLYKLQEGGDVTLISYLPLAHILERVAEELFLQEGGSIGYWQGDVRQLKDDIIALKPTLMPAVPRVLDRFYDVIQGTLSAKSGLAKRIFKAGFNAKQNARSRQTQTRIWDLLLFNKIKGNIGGRMRGILSGSAPLRAEVQNFLSVVFDCPIFQGYGLTETAAAATIQIPEDRSTSHIGCPLACNEIKLVDVPDLNYLSSNDPPQGEICVRGPNVALGYYKDEEMTREVFDSDGWFHTGDVGQWNRNGTLSVIDRIKNIFKLAQGEYVAVERIEQQLGTCSYVSQLWIYGDSLKSCLIAVIVVEPVSVSHFAKSIGLTCTQDNVSEVIRDKRVIDEVLKTVTAAARESGLKGFEIPKAVHLVDKEFSEFDCVTPSMKLQRNKLKAVFQQEIDRMYTELDAADNARS